MEELKLKSREMLQEKTFAKLIDLGVDYISSGALTHSSQFLIYLLRIYRI